VTDEGFELALAALAEAELLDSSAEAEAVRNVVVDPLIGIDPARADVRDLAAALEDALRLDSRLWALPGKFGFSLSGVASPRIGGKGADIMISADGSRFHISLDGAADACCEISRGDVIDAARHLALAFVELKENDASFRRMRDAVGRLRAATVFAMAGLKMAMHARGSVELPAPVGLLMRDDSAFAVGVGLPFGRITAGQLDMLCDAAVAVGAQEIRTGPERILVVPISNTACGAALFCDAEAAGLITRASDIRLAMDVCPGAPACKNARTDTRRDAQRFAEAFTPSLGGHSLHISGCEKGCAHRGAASFTLVGRDGGYDIIKNGSADSTSVLETIDADDIHAAISRLTMEPAI
jgi:precorrin-3B synthase